MNVPTNLKYTASHEWIRSEPDGTLTIGITDHAQEALGDLVFIELPAVGRKVKAGERCRCRILARCGGLYLGHRRGMRQ